MCLDTKGGHGGLDLEEVEAGDVTAGKWKHGHSKIAPGSWRKTPAFSAPRPQLNSLSVYAKSKLLGLHPLVSSATPIASLPRAPRLQHSLPAQAQSLLLSASSERS